MIDGKRSVTLDAEDMFTWPIITKEDEDAALDVLRKGKMSGLDVTKKFEEEYAAWQGNKFALGFNNGTASLQSAMWAVGIKAGDEVICQSVTYWASILPCLSLGAVPVFAEIDPKTLTLDPNDIEHRISKRTKAIVVQHNYAYPTDMDPIMEIAKKHGIKIIEDLSHSQGTLYKGKKVGTFGDVSGISLMSGKSLIAGEAGMLTTDDEEIYERAAAWGHYSRNQGDLKAPSIKDYWGIPLGGYKYRMHQISAAVGRVQLKHYDTRCEEMTEAMNYFWDQLEDTPGIQGHRPDKNSGSTMGGWYSCKGLYSPEELGGLSVTAYINALKEEGVRGDIGPGLNFPLHLHPVFNEVDIYGHGKPTVLAFADQDRRQGKGSLPVSESIWGRVIYAPWFKHFRKGIIDEYVAAFKKVSDNYESLLKTDPGDPKPEDRMNFSTRNKN